MKNVATIKVILYASKTLANGEHPLMLRICKNRMRKYMATGLSCKPEFWDTKKNEPRRNHPQRLRVKTFIDHIVSEYQNQALELDTDGKEFTADTLLNLSGKNVRKVTVFAFLNEKLEDFRSSGHIGNAKVYNTLKHSLWEFTRKMDIHFSEIDFSFLKRFETHLRKKGLSEVSLSNRFRTLRALYNSAISMKVARKQNYPFHEFKISKFDVSTRKRAITKEDIHRIMDLSIPENSSLFASRQYFIFSYYCLGINFVDIAGLRWNDISNGQVQYKRAKTGKEISFGLLPQAEAILDNFRSHIDSIGNEYVFPILNSNIHKTAIQKDNRVRKVLKQVNRDLKHIGELAGIKFPLTTYVARHTFAMTLKRGMVNISLISEAMGHSSESVTKVYLDSFGSDLIHQTMQKHL